MKWNIVVATCVAAMVSGCAYTPREVADPKAITLKDAMTDVATSLNETRKIAEQEDKLGLIADEVTITFNVSAKGTSSNKLTLTPSNIPFANGLLGGSAEAGLDNEGLRGNTITVKFKNLATADLSKGSLDEVKRCNRKPRPRDCIIWRLVE